MRVAPAAEARQPVDLLLAEPEGIDPGKARRIDKELRALGIDHDQGPRVRVQPAQLVEFAAELPGRGEGPALQRAQRRGRNAFARDTLQHLLGQDVGHRPVDLLVEHVLQEEQADEADQAGDQRRQHPARADAAQHVPADRPAAPDQADAEHRADHGLRAGDRHQGNGRQAVLRQQPFQALGGEEEEDERMGHDRDPGGDRRERHQAPADGHHYRP